MAVFPLLTTHRSGETSRQEFIRHGRFARINNLWYFKTREGVDYGPFNSQTECKYAYEEFIDVVAYQTSLSIDVQEVSIQSDSNLDLEPEPDWKIPKIDFL
jgi:hypothetical protein